MRKLLLFLLFTTTALALFAQTGASDDPDGDAIINSSDLDLDNDGIINALEVCNATGLMSYSETRIGDYVSDVFIKLGGLEIGKIRITIIPNPALDATIQNRLKVRQFNNVSDPARYVQENVVDFRYYQRRPGFHDGTEIQFDLELYAEYNYYADDIKFYLFGGVTGVTQRSDIDEFEIQSTQAYTFSDAANRIEYLDAGGTPIGPSDGLNVAANINQKFKYSAPPPGNRREIQLVQWFLSTDGTLGSSDDGATKTMSLTYKYTLGSDQVEGLGFAVFFNNTNCNNDLDSDGVPNIVDLDSDNDGCPDAYEYINKNARVSLINERLLGNNGTNGLNNALEANDTNDSTVGYAFNGTNFDSDNNLVPDHTEAGATNTSNCPKVITGTALTGNAAIGNVGISTVPNTANQAYFANGTTQALDVVSKTKGVGLPLVSNANLPATATPGTVLWNTDENCLMLWHADNGSGSAGWACVQRAGDGL